ncbi:MAG TPA: AMP-binding protein, partial [Thermoplasmata archaeon]|nr:AMP-binding protein [Thermoplasmata archaeon]
MPESSLSGPAGSRPWLTHYPPGIPPDIDIPDKRLPDLVGDVVKRNPGRTALVYYGARWTYRRFWESAGGFANALAREGIRPGDRLALYLPNCPAYPIAYFGALRAGVTVVQVSPLYIGQDLVRLLKDASPKGIVTLEILYPNLQKVGEEVDPGVRWVARLRELYPWWKRPFVNSVLRRRGLPTAVPTGPSIRNWTASLRTTGTLPELSTDPRTEVAVLQYTGGTTGRPKA